MSAASETCCSLQQRELNTTMQIALLHNKELVCMAMSRNLVAIGSQSHISMLDPRMAQPSILSDDSIDPGQVCGS